jgi:hypothetical protein
MSHEAERTNPKRLILGNATEWLDLLDARFAAEETEDWQFAYKRTNRVEYEARQARQVVRELRCRIQAFDSAVAGTPSEDA